MTLILVLLLTTVLVACQPRVESDPEVIQLAEPLGDDWTLTMTIENVTPTGATVVFTHEGDGALITVGEFFHLEKLSDGEWRELDPVREGFAFNAIGYMVPNNDSFTLDTKWEYVYGALSAGRYRVCKDAHIEGVRHNEYEGDLREEHYKEERDLYAEFEIAYTEEDIASVISYAEKHLSGLGIKPTITAEEEKIIFTFDAETAEELGAEEMLWDWEIYKMLRDNSEFAPFGYYGVYYRSEDGELVGGGGSTLPYSSFSAKSVAEKTDEEICSDIEGLFSPDYKVERIRVDGKTVSLGLCEITYTSYPDLETIAETLESYYKETACVPASCTELFDADGKCIAVVCKDAECGKFSVWFDQRFAQSFAQMGYGPKID